MTDYQKRDMSGTLWRNDRREKDSHPNMQGTAIVDGVEFWVSAWTKEGAKGKFISLSFKRKDEAVAKAKQETQSRSFEDDLSDDLPF